MNLEKSNENKDILNKLDEIAKLLRLNKPVLTVEEASLFSGIKQSYLYRLTSERKIPHSCPRGKLLYFDTVELTTWLLENKVLTQDQLEIKANTYIISKNK